MKSKKPLMQTRIGTFMQYRIQMPRCYDVTKNVLTCIQGLKGSFPKETRPHGREKARCRNVNPTSTNALLEGAALLPL
jgi:hypothetical protein